MNSKEAKGRIEKLKEVINRHRYLYHVLDRQEISDSALDSLKKELFDLEQRFPEFLTADSPTQRVGGEPLDKFEKVKHSVPMLSFNDAFSGEDVKEWLERNEKLLTGKERSGIDFYCELKIDGLAIELVYEKGILKQGSTRGDGVVGENVTQNLKTIESMPLRLLDEKTITVRGEVFILKKEFERINKEREKGGLPVYANPRNLAAGSVRQLDRKITASRNMDFFAYEIVESGKRTSIINHEEKHKILKGLGFKVNGYNKYCRNLDEVFEYYNYVQGIRDSLPYEIDGIVIIINPSDIYNKLGVIGKAPRGAIAFKFPIKQATTKVEDIKIHVGRTGALTPIAVLKPVEVGGVRISRATLHNEDEIKRLDLKIGDTVIIGRAGDVIPDIVKVLKDLRTGKEKDFKMPKKCPVCGSLVVKPAGEIISRCSNSECFAQKKEYFYHFVSKGAFDITGLGPKIIDRLLEEELISNPADIFRLEEGDLLPLDRFAERSAKNLIESIQSKKEIDFPRFVYALGIRNVGEETAVDLANHFLTIDKLRNAGKESLEEIQDIGPVVAESIFSWFNDKKNKDFLDKLLKTISIRSQKPKTKNKKLDGLTFVFTGEMDSLTRGEAKRKVRESGGNASESVSRDTDYLVAGKSPGSKYEKAKKMKVKIIDEKEFLKML